MRLVLLEAAANEPLTADEARLRLNIGDDVSDDLLEILIRAARQSIDGPQGWLSRALITQKWRGTMDCFPCDFVIPLPPLQEVTSLQYVDNDGNVQEVDASVYEIVQGPRPRIVLASGQSWPSHKSQADAVAIEFVAGYGDEAQDVPEPIRFGLAMKVRSLLSSAQRDPAVLSDAVTGIGQKTYAEGSNTSALDIAAQALLWPYRVFA